MMARMQTKNKYWKLSYLLSNRIPNKLGNNDNNDRNPLNNKEAIQIH